MANLATIIVKSGLFKELKREGKGGGQIYSRCPDNHGDLVSY